jgi:copper chaperone CopZ
MQTTEMVSPEIMCEGCANAIKKALGGVEGVERVEVNIDDKRVSVIHAETTTKETLLKKMDGAGFPVEE